MSALLDRRDGMSRRGKVGLVVAGYIVAFLITVAFIAVYTAATNSPDRQASGGMSAFGDSLLFLGVLGMASVPATGAALYFLRRGRGVRLCPAHMALA